MVIGPMAALAPAARVPPVETTLVTVLPAGSVTTSRIVTPVRVAVPQLVTEPETWKEPADNWMFCGPQTLATWMQAVLVTTVTQVWEVLEVGPQGPLPVTPKKSLMVPQVVRLMVWTGTATAVWAATVPIGMVIVSTLPFALVIVSVTTTPVRSAVPQLVTEPETVKEPAERSIEAGPQTLLTWTQAVLVTRVTQV